MKNDYLQILNQDYKCLRQYYFVYFLIACAATILFLINQVAAVVLFVVYILFRFTIIRAKIKQYQQSYTHACIQFTMDKHLKNAQHTKSPTLDQETLRQARLIPDKNQKGSILLIEGVQGQGHGHPVLLGDAVFANTFLIGERKKHNEFASGCWIQITLPHDTGLDWRLIHKDAIMEESLSLMKSKNADLQSPEDTSARWINDDFNILRLDGTPDFPTDPVLSVLHKMAENITAPLSVCMKGNQVHVYLRSRFLGQKVNPRQVPDEALIQSDILPELAQVLSLADTLAKA